MKNDAVLIHLLGHLHCGRASIERAGIANAAAGPCTIGNLK